MQYVSNSYAQSYFPTIQPQTLSFGGPPVASSAIPFSLGTPVGTQSVAGAGSTLSSFLSAFTRKASDYPIGVAVGAPVDGMGYSMGTPTTIGGYLSAAFNPSNKDDPRGESYYVGAPGSAPPAGQIGRASCRERV